MITQLAVGEALVSMLEGKGVPAMVERTLIAPPASRVGPITPAERAELMARSALRGKYDTTVDRESAYEVLKARANRWTDKAAGGAADSPAEASAAGGGFLSDMGSMIGGLFHRAPGAAGKGRSRMSTSEVIMRSAAQSAARSIGTQIARAVLRGVLGGLSR